VSATTVSGSSLSFRLALLPSLSGNALVLLAAYAGSAYNVGEAGLPHGLETAYLEPDPVEELGTGRTADNGRLELVVQVGAGSVLAVLVVAAARSGRLLYGPAHAVDAHVAVAVGVPLAGALLYAEEAPSGLAHARREAPVPARLVAAVRLPVGRGKYLPALAALAINVGVEPEVPARPVLAVVVRAGRVVALAPLAHLLVFLVVVVFAFALAPET